MKPYIYAIGVFLLSIPFVGFSSTILIPGDYPNIQAAIDAAGDGDTILIADGVYSGPGNRDIQWDANLKHLAVVSENGRDHSILDCMGEGRGFLLNNGQDQRDVIEGLTIANGMVYGGGGAIYVHSTSPTIRNCTFLRNTASGYHDNSYSGCGGAILVHEESSPLIQGNIIRENVASNLGGGIVFAEFSSGQVENNIIDGNKALDDWGGGIALWNNSDPLIINNLIINNSCSGFNGGRGGGIYLDHSDTKIVNNTIAFNSTSGDEYGDGIGGGICIGGWAAPVIRNCVIWYNRSGATSMNIYFDPMEWLDISYSNVEEDLGHIFDLEPHTNLDVPPAFVDTAGGNFQLSWDSPCINKGIADTSGLHLPILDISGNPRIFEGTVDIGAYEYNSPTGVSEILPDRDFILYPNPGPGFFYLEYRGGKVLQDLQLRVYNVSGEIVPAELSNAHGNMLLININMQPEGIYFLLVFSKDRLLFRQKFVKE